MAANNMITIQEKNHRIWKDNISLEDKIKAATKLQEELKIMPELGKQQCEALWLSIQRRINVAREIIQKSNQSQGYVPQYQQPQARVIPHQTALQQSTSPQNSGNLAEEIKRVEAALAAFPSSNQQVVRPSHALPQQAPAQVPYPVQMQQPPMQQYQPLPVYASPYYQPAPVIQHQTALQQSTPPQNSGNLAEEIKRVEAALAAFPSSNQQVVRPSHALPPQPHAQVPYSVQMQQPAMQQSLQPQRLYTRDVDLTKMPVPTTHSWAYPGSQITIGDLHGNALKLIFMLLEHGIASNIDASDYQKLSSIYYTISNPLSKQNIADFISIISKLKLRKDVTIRLIGDILADRGSNDYFTLKVLEKLRSEEVPVTILFSNHDEEFIRKFELGQIFNDFDISDTQVVSAIRLHNLIDEGKVTRKEVDDLIRDVYKPCLKLIDYSYDREHNLLDYHTHAPIGMPYKLCLKSEIINDILAPGKIYIDEAKGCCSVLDPFGYRWDNISLAGIDLSKIAQRLNESALRKSILEKTSQVECRSRVGCTPRVTVQDLAEYMGVTYDDHDASALMQTFDRINEQFGNFAEANLIHKLYNVPLLGEHDSYDNCADGNPINSIAWSRNEYIYVPQKYGDYGLRVSYGHTGGRDESDPENIIKLNNKLGATPSITGGTYTVLYTPPGTKIANIARPPATTQSWLKIITEVYSNRIPYSEKLQSLFNIRNELNNSSMSLEERGSISTMIDCLIQIDFLDRLSNLNEKLLCLIQKLERFKPEIPPKTNMEIRRDKWEEKFLAVFQELKYFEIISTEKYNGYETSLSTILTILGNENRTKGDHDMACTMIEAIVRNLKVSLSFSHGLKEEQLQQQLQQQQLQQQQLQKLQQQLQQLQQQLQQPKQQLQQLQQQLQQPQQPQQQLQQQQLQQQLQQQKQQQLQQQKQQQLQQQLQQQPQQQLQPQQLQQLQQLQPQLQLQLQLQQQQLLQQQLQPQRLQTQQLQPQQLQPQQVQQLQPQQLQSQQKIQKPEEIKRQLQQLDQLSQSLKQLQQSLKELQGIEKVTKQEIEKLKQKTQSEQLKIQEIKQLQELEDLQEKNKKQEKVIEEKVKQLKIQLQQLEPLQQPAVSHIETTPRQTAVAGMAFFGSHYTQGEETNKRGPHQTFSPKGGNC